MYILRHTYIYWVYIETHIYTCMYILRHTYTHVYIETHISVPRAQWLTVPRAQWLNVYVYIETHIDTCMYWDACMYIEPLCPGHSGMYVYWATVPWAQWKASRYVYWATVPWAQWRASRFLCLGCRFLCLGCKVQCLGCRFLCLGCRVCQCYMCTYIYICICIYIYSYIDMYISCLPTPYTLHRICICVSQCIHVCLWDTHIYTHTYNTHTQTLHTTMRIIRVYGVWIRVKGVSFLTCLRGSFLNGCSGAGEAL